jgi:DegV family protein with EDD domain
MVKIISDSTCDLSQELLRRYEIDILPLHILLGEQEYLDGVDITPDDIYRWGDEHKTTPKTSAVSMEDTIRIMKRYLEQGNELICFSISDQMSTTGNVMRLAAQELEAEDHVTVINSENLSTGIGLLVIEAAILSSEGKTRQEISARIEELKPLVRASFVVDSLTYLYRGGRCSGLAAMAGGVLKLHPKIIVKNGVMSAEKKYRGKLENAILTYAKDMETDLLHAKKDRVFITHSGCDPEVIQSVRDYLESLQHFDEIHITRAGGVISSHCGWGTLGVLFIAQSANES